MNESQNFELTLKKSEFTSIIRGLYDYLNFNHFILNKKSQELSVELKSGYLLKSEEILSLVSKLNKENIKNTEEDLTLKFNSEEINLMCCSLDETISYINGLIRKDLIKKELDDSDDLNNKLEEIIKSTNELKMKILKFFKC